MRKFIMVIVTLLFSMITLAASAATFTQADLTGTWRISALSKGYQSDGTTPLNEWMRARYSIDASGDVSCLDMTDSNGYTTCPPSFDVTLTMNETTGVITQSGADASSDGHMTMTLNKNFMADTQTHNSGHGYQLMTAQKEMTGTSYTAADLQSKSFVFHRLIIGTNNKWQYGAGTTNGSGVATFSSVTEPSGTIYPPGTQGTLSVDGAGVVTISGINFKGYLSDDKKTIVGTFSQSGSGYADYNLMIIQITGQTYTAGTMPALTSAAHTLGVGASNVAFWIHYTTTINSSGVMTFSDWLDSNGGSAPVGTFTGYITSSGTVTIDGSSTYHGQASHDGMFLIGTQSIGSYYSLNVSTNTSVCSTKKAKVNNNYFDTLQAAYDSATDGNTLQIYEYLLTADVVFNRNITAFLEGGYNCKYETNAGYTTVDGSITINNGTVTVENIIIK